jgi:hypothetical protein
MRSYFRAFFIVLMTMMLFVQCSTSKAKVHFAFDGSKEMSGQKFALKDINPNLPKDWDGYGYVSIEYKITTAQRFQLGFTTDSGYNELRVMCYVPNAWNRIAIPLKYFTELPDPTASLASTYNKPRYMGWINLGGKRGPLHGVDSIGVRIRRAIGAPEIWIRNVTLSVDDPGDAYLEKKPAIDEFGQSMLVDYPEKVKSLDELQAQWRAEESEPVSTKPYNYSKFGGYVGTKLQATGFFRTVNKDGKWWFVDPEGYLFLSVGVDCVSPANGGGIRDYDKRPNLYKALPPQDLVSAWRNGDDKEIKYSLGAWNEYRRFGDAWWAKSNDLIIKRMDNWGLNTIANWSSMDVMRLNKKAFLLSLDEVGMDPSMMGLADVYAPDFIKKLELSISQSVAENLDNPWLIGYFVANEPSWVNEEPRVCQLILDGPQRPIKTALQEYLAKNGDSNVTRRAFVISSFRKFLEDVKVTFKKYDPNHLNLGMRLGDPNTLGDDMLAACNGMFDVFSFNCYDLLPRKAMLDRAYRLTGLPMMVGEFHFGTVDRGMAQSLWQVESQKQRGVAYRYYLENAYSNPAFIGSAYFEWCDEDITGRFDGENYNCGLVDVTDRPYKEIVDAVKETGKRLFAVHSGTTSPVTQQPHNARGHEAVPDLWNK